MKRAGLLRLQRCFLYVVLESGFVDDNGLTSTSISSCFYRAGGTGARGGGLFSPPEIGRSDPDHQVTLSQPGGGADYTHYITICPPPHRVSQSSPGFVFYATHNCMVIPGSRSAWYHSGKFYNYLDIYMKQNVKNTYQWNKNWWKLKLPSMHK